MYGVWHLKIPLSFIKYHLYNLWNLVSKNISFFSWDIRSKIYSLSTQKYTEYSSWNIGSQYFSLRREVIPSARYTAFLVKWISHCQWKRVACAMFTESSILISGGTALILACLFRGTRCHSKKTSTVIKHALSAMRGRNERPSNIPSTSWFPLCWRQ